jgi:hypothetical protein
MPPTLKSSQQNQMNEIIIVATNVSAITASTKQKLVGIIQSNDTATMVLPKEADSQTKDFQNAAAYQSNKSIYSSKSTYSTNSVPDAITTKSENGTNSSTSTSSTNSSNSVPDPITMTPNTSCALHATGNFTRSAVPRALANYSVFLSGFQNQSLESSLGKEDDATCEFHGNIYQPDPLLWIHFPHTMQHLYSCISWWNGHPSHPSVLAWSSKTHGKQLRSDRFVGGRIKSLVNNNNVTFLETLDQLPTTRSPQATVGPFPWLHRQISNAFASLS